MVLKDRRLNIILKDWQSALIKSFLLGRSRRPPRDEFNSMISLGYSILMNEVYCKIENERLESYFGFIHRDAEKHPTLASDMMEEYEQ